MKNIWNITISSILIGLMLSACVPTVPATGAPGVTPQTTERPAQVQSVSIEVIDGNPPQVNAVVKGNLSESCATLAPVQVSYASDTFEIKVYAVSPSDRGCAQITAPFETTVPLDVR